MTKEQVKLLNDNVSSLVMNKLCTWVEEVVAENAPFDKFEVISKHGEIAWYGKIEKGGKQ